ncbi:hypothetical protein SAMN06309944_0236 [Micrococcales bacterium KH10]|nr:hypothetical protein SAMN06309944_0236 [Micrococcales bacterium KH10]
MSELTEKIAREHGVDWISGGSDGETIGCQCGARNKESSDSGMMSAHVRHVAEVTEAAVRAERVTPSREALILAIAKEVDRAIGSDWPDSLAPHQKAILDAASRAVLALLPGRSEAVVKAEALREAAAGMPRVSWGDFWDEDKQKYGAHIQEVVDPHSKPFPTIRSVGIEDWLHARAEEIERGGSRG